MRVWAESCRADNALFQIQPTVLRQPQEERKIICDNVASLYPHD